MKAKTTARRNSYWVQSHNILKAALRGRYFVTCIVKLTVEMEMIYEDVGSKVRRVTA